MLEFIQKHTYSFKHIFNLKILSNINNKYDIQIKVSQIAVEIEEDKIKLLLIDLLKIDYSKNFKIDELPVEEPMRTFFTSPDSILYD